MILQLIRLLEFVAALRSNLRTSKPKYAEIIKDTKTFNDEAEGLLKEVIASTKQSFA